MYKNKIKDKLNRIAANYIELNHRPILITKEKAEQSLIFRPQRKKLSLSKDLSKSSVHNHNQSIDTILQDQDSSCKKQFMKVFSHSCSKQLQKVESTTLRLNHNPSSLYLSKRVNSQQIHGPQRLFFGNQTEHNQDNNKRSLPLSHTGSKQKIIPVLIQAVNSNTKKPNNIIDNDTSYKAHAQRAQSVFTIDTQIKNINNHLFQTPIRHFKTSYDEEQQTTFRKEEPKTASLKNNCIYEQENASMKKTSRFVCGDHLQTSKGLQKAKIIPNTENLCKENIFLEHSNRFVSPKYQNKHRIQHSPAPILRASTEASLQLKHSNRPSTSYQLSNSKAVSYLPISREIQRVQEQRKQIESRITKKLDQLSERAKHIAKMCKADDNQRQFQQHRKPKILVSSSSKNIKYAASMEPPSPSLANASSDFISRKASKQVNSYLLNSAHGSLRHQILNRIYS